MSSERLSIALAASLALTFAASAARADERTDTRSAALEQARQHFERGTSLARTGRCDLARVELLASLALVERPNAYFNLARCDERLERRADALREYLAFLDRADAGDGHRAEVRGRIEALRHEVATLNVEADIEGAEVVLDGESLGAAPSSRFVDPGTVVVVVRHEGFEVATRTIALARGETQTWSVSLVPIVVPAAAADEPMADLAPAFDDEPSAPPPRTRTRARFGRGPFYAGLALTGSSLVFGASFGIHALRERAEGERIDPFDADARAAAQRRVRAASQVADIGYAATLGFAVATTIVGVFTDFRRPTDEGTIRVAPNATASSFGLAVTGRY